MADEGMGLLSVNLKVQVKTGIPCQSLTPGLDISGWNSGWRPGTWSQGVVQVTGCLFSITDHFILLTWLLLRVM